MINKQSMIDGDDPADPSARNWAIGLMKKSERMSVAVALRAVPVCV